MKRVSFKVAKALKDAGYPQENCDEYLNKYGVVDGYFGHNTARPTYLEAWLWLWREKKIVIDVNYIWASNTWWDGGISGGEFNDPEDVIMEAVEHIVHNDLIK